MNDPTLSPNPGLSALRARYDVILSDIWGVVHDGKASSAPACDALTRFRAQGGTVALITNAPRTSAPIRAQMRHLGVPDSAFDALVTSGDVTLELMMKRGGAPLYHIGPDRDLSLFAELALLQGGAPPRLVPLAQADYVVATGLFNDRAETAENYDATFAAMRLKNMDMICANPDLVVHIGEQLIYCAGALAERHSAQGGASIYAGKPHAPIYERAMELAERTRGAPVSKTRVLAIGDAMRTDIAGAAAQGYDAMFVTSGIHRDGLHPGGGAFDAAAYAALTRGLTHPPRYVAQALSWD